MTNKIYFDTLKYAKLLASSGIEYADIHAQAVSQALNENNYTKREVEKMIETAIKENREALERIFKESDEKMQAIKLEMKDIMINNEKTFNRYLILNISILGSLIVLVGTLSSLFAHFAH